MAKPIFTNKDDKDCMAILTIDTNERTQNISSNDIDMMLDAQERLKESGVNSEITDKGNLRVDSLDYGKKNVIGATMGHYHDEGSDPSYEIQSKGNGKTFIAVFVGVLAAIGIFIVAAYL